MPNPVAAASPEVWVGPKYAGGFEGKRLLIVGESRPNAQDKFRIGLGLQAALTGQYVDSEVKHRVFTDLARMCLGEPASRERCEEFFRQVALANLSLGSGAGEINEKGRALSQDFARLLVDLQPSIVLVLGTALKSALSEATVSRDSGSSTLTLLYAPHPGSPGFSFRDHIGTTAQLRSIKKALAAR